MPRDTTRGSARPTPAPLRAAREGLGWAVANGLPLLSFRRAAARGDLMARLEVDPGLRADPFPSYEVLRGRGPIVRGAMIASSVDHSVATEVLRSDAFGVFGANRELPPLLQLAVGASWDPWTVGPVEPPAMLAVDPPDHGRYRRLVTRAFTARAVQRLEARVVETATELLDAVEARLGRDGGDFDVATDYAALLPVAVIAEILGVPAHQHRQLLAWGNDAAWMLDPALTWRQLRQSRRSLFEMHRWLEEHISALRRDPGEDLLSRLAVLEGEERLSDVELRTTALLVLGAGFETTVNLIGNAVALLGAHPDQRARVREDAGLWPNVVEEVLRFDSPVQLTGRIPLRDVEIGGTTLRRGEPVLLYLGGANRDPAVFTDPQRFDVARSDAGQHLAFSSGAHYCLGAGLARLEASVALRMLYERFPDLDVDAPGTRRGTRVLRGWEHLPVTTHARSRAA